MPYQYYIFHKPFGVLSQFTREIESHITLADYLDLDEDIYPVGRLDRDSEGLLLLTNDNRLKTRLLDPKSKSPKTYWVQLDGAVDAQSLQNLRSGVTIKLKKGMHRTLPAKVTTIDPKISERKPPVRIRKSIPTSWIEITITEGKNRQIRKMCASIGFPCLRLIRVKIKGLSFDDVINGQYRPLTTQELKALKST